MFVCLFVKQGLSGNPWLTLNLQSCVGITGANQNVWPILILSTHIVPCKQVALNKYLLMQMPCETVDVKMRRGTIGKTVLFGWGGGHAATDGGVLFTSPDQW